MSAPDDVLRARRFLSWQRPRLDVPELQAESIFRFAGPALALAAFFGARWLGKMETGDAWLYLFYGLLVAFPVSTGVELVTSWLARRRPWVEPTTGSAP